MDIELFLCNQFTSLGDADAGQGISTITVSNELNHQSYFFRKVT